MTPSERLKPALFMDGNMWCALHGADLVVGVAGFGPTRAEALADFDREWMRRNTEFDPQPISLN